MLRVWVFALLAASTLAGTALDFPEIADAFKVEEMPQINHPFAADVVTDEAAFSTEDLLSGMGVIDLETALGEELAMDVSSEIAAVDPVLSELDSQAARTWQANLAQTGRSQTAIQSSASQADKTVQDAANAIDQTQNEASRSVLAATNEAMGSVRAESRQVARAAGKLAASKAASVRQQQRRDTRRLNDDEKSTQRADRREGSRIEGALGELAQSDMRRDERSTLRRETDRTDQDIADSGDVIRRENKRNLFEEAAGDADQERDDLVDFLRQEDDAADETASLEKTKAATREKFEQQSLDSEVDSLTSSLSRMDDVTSRRKHFLSDLKQQVSQSHEDDVRRDELRRETARVTNAADNAAAETAALDGLAKEARRDAAAERKTIEKNKKSVKATMKHGQESRQLRRETSKVRRLASREADKQSSSRSFGSIEKLVKKDSAAVEKIERGNMKKIASKSRKLGRELTKPKSLSSAMESEEQRLKDVGRNAARDVEGVIERGEDREAEQQEIAAVKSDEDAIAKQQRRDETSEERTARDTAAAVSRSATRDEASLEKGLEETKSAVKRGIDDVKAGAKVEEKEMETEVSEAKDAAEVDDQQKSLAADLKKSAIKNIKSAMKSVKNHFKRRADRLNKQMRRF